jgi:hypothetical protein
MKHWRLDQPKGEKFNRFKKNTFDGEYLEIPKYPTDVWWRYFTTLHLTGTATRLTRDEHILHLDRIESRQYYSKASVNAMEARHLARIAKLRREAEGLDDDTYAEAAGLASSRIKKGRKNCRSDQPKIDNSRRLLKRRHGPKA